MTHCHNKNDCLNKCKSRVIFHKSINNLSKIFLKTGVFFMQFLFYLILKFYNLFQNHREMTITILFASYFEKLFLCLKKYIKKWSVADLLYVFYCLY